MKKIFLAIMAVAAITFSACSGTAKGGPETDSIAAVATEKANEAISELSTAIESASAEDAKSVLTKAKDYITQLQKEGKIEEAKTYLVKVQKYIAENEETINEFAAGNETISNIVATIKAIPADALDVANNIAVDTEAAVEEAKEAGSEAIEEAEEQVKEAVEDAEEKAKEAANEVVDKAAEDAKNAIKDKLGL
jgi:hypothetical protein